MDSISKMSFLEFNNDRVSYGDTVFVYINHKSIFIQKMGKGKVFQCKFGALKHDNVVGQLYGSKISCPRGYVYILKATPELWTICLPHRTQILYFADISYVVSSLELSPGCFVIEAGTGSGSMTHSLARTVAPNGKVYTFDFHQKRTEEARIEFRDHGLSDIIIAQHQDVCTDGFPKELSGKIDAVFLDLPHPWDAVVAAKTALKSGGRICCFSPCIEQVQRTVASLRENFFIEMSTIEVLIKPVDTAKKVTLKKLTFDDEDNKSVNGNNNTSSSTDELVEYTVCFPTVTQAGHTGFLSFATKI